MKCPYCGGEGNTVIDSRQKDENNTIARRRVCFTCNKRFSTVEYIYKSPDGSFNARPGGRMITLATGSNKTHEFFLLIKKKKEEKK